MADDADGGCGWPVAAALEQGGDDGVRWSKQLLDVLGQLACLPATDAADPARSRATDALPATAAQAVLDMNRGVVSWSAV